MPDHPQTRIEHDGFAAEVDVEIADLLVNLWRLDLWTSLSCQDNFGKVWIMFEDGGAAQAFLSIVAGKFDDDADSLYNRVLDGFQPDEEADYEDFRENRAWLNKVSVEDRNVRTEFTDDDERIVTPVGPPVVEFNVSLHFPRSDLPEVERRVAAHLARTENTSAHTKPGKDGG
jgi:hypothetical protein